MKAAIYARVSAGRQAERGTIGSQIEALRAHLAAAGEELAGQYCDDGRSGARLDRPGLDARRDAAQAGLFEVVYCLSPDRLARSCAYQVLILDELARLGACVRFTDAPGRDQDDPQARLLTQVQGVIAEYERAKIGERYRRGKLFRSRAGEVISRKAPTATGASPGARMAPRTWRSSNPRPPWRGGSSPPAPPGPPSGRSAASSTPMRCLLPPAAAPCGAPPRSTGCCATRPTSAGSTTTAPRSSRTAGPAAGPARCPAP